MGGFKQGAIRLVIILVAAVALIAVVNYFLAGG